ncbi:MAG: hypothetical protein DRQ08_04970 [Candidatus Latescibacterota bacterium]|nr:MAG: hypothetical protein DRQ08_04970 [Candidatus Latescibacterota bacterium]
MNTLALALDEPAPLEGWRLWAFVALELALVVLGVGFFQHILLLMAVVLGVGLFFFLPAMPYVLLPLAFLASTLDLSGILIKTELFNITYFHLFGGGLILFTLAHMLYRGDTSFPRLPIIVPLSFFIMSMGLSSLYSPSTLEGLVLAVRIFLLSVLLLIMAVLIRSPKMAGWAIFWLLALGIAMSIIGIVQTATEQVYFLPAEFVNLVGATTPRATGLYHNPNEYATFLMVCIILASALMLGAQKGRAWLRVVLGFVILVLMAGLIVSFSRSNWLATLVGVGLIAILSRRVKLMLWVLAAGLAILGIIAMLSSNIAELVVSRFESIFKIFRPKEFFGSDVYVSSSVRVLLVVASWHMFLDHPFGIGTRGFPKVFEQYKPPNYPIWVPVRENHTLQARILAEQGIIGFLIYIWLVYVVVKGGLEAVRWAEEPYIKAVAVGLLGVFVGYQVNFLFTAALTDNFFWMTTGMLFAVREIVRPKEAS